MGWRDQIVEKGRETVSNNRVDLGINTKKPNKPAPEPQPEKPVEAKTQPEINNKYNFDRNKTYLVVGGKIKEISSKSKYLLDMLIIEEEN
jgi:hypothetical protein